MKSVSTYNTIRWIEIQNNISSFNIYLNQEAKINVNSVKLINFSLRACLDASVSKGSGYQAWWPECDPWDPHGGALWPPHRYPGLHRNTQTNMKSLKIFFIDGCQFSGHVIKWINWSFVDVFWLWHLILGMKILDLCLKVMHTEEYCCHCYCFV